MTDCNLEPIRFPSCKGRLVEASFSGGAITSDGGAVLLRQADRMLGLTDRARGIVRDQTVALSGYYSGRRYPRHLRRIRFKDPQTQKTLAFPTKRFDPPPLAICELYEARWQVELFFKWIKRHLRIKKFYGTSVNAVKTQVWVAVTVYVLVAIVKKRLELEASLHTLLQIFSVTSFEKTPFNRDFPDAGHITANEMGAKQLKLF